LFPPSLKNIVRELGNTLLRNLPRVILGNDDDAVAQLLKLHFTAPELKLFGKPDRPTVPAVEHLGPLHGETPSLEYIRTHIY